MKAIALEFTFYTDVIEVPDNIAKNIRKNQSKFDEWLCDKSI